MEQQKNKSAYILYFIASGLMYMSVVVSLIGNNHNSNAIVFYFILASLLLILGIKSKKHLDANNNSKNNKTNKN